MVVDTKLYDILGVSPKASDQELKKAYQTKARQLHPDKNRDDPQATEKFQQLNEAYEILKDPQRRQLYDQYGPDALRGEGGAGFDDILSHLFGGGGGGFFGGGGNFFGGGGGRGHQRRARTQDQGHVLRVGLEDLYNGKEVTLKINRDVVCSGCGGSGCLKGKSQRRCSACEGRGQRVAITRMGNMITQQIVTCPDCSGQGVSVDPKDHCKKCHGKKIVQESKVIILHIQPGMEDGEQIRFQGCADEAPGAETGDFVVKLEQKPNTRFARHHADLLVAKKITLAQALLGVSFVLTHLDGRKLVVSSQAGHIIVPEAVKVIEREGMPQRGNQGQKGKLFVKFEVEFPRPDQLTLELKGAFTTALSVVDEAAGLDSNQEDVFPVTMRDGDIRQFENAKSSREERQGEAYSSRDEGYEEPQGAQCRPM